MSLSSSVAVDPRSEGWTPARARIGRLAPPDPGWYRCRHHGRRIDIPEATTNAIEERLAAAREGDEDAFAALVAPHRRELQAHCYRMLGSYHDAEDALQETLLTAWRGIAAFEGRSSLRTWLFRIATNRCLNVRRSAVRRPEQPWDVAGIRPPEPTGLGTTPWLEPWSDVDADPSAPAERAETVSLAFVTALQVLPPRQVAVLLLREVLGFPSAEVAAMLGTGTGAVDSALKRARAGLARRGAARGAAPRAGSPAEAALVAAFVRAYEASDVRAVVGLLTDDVLMSMPPIALEYRGRDAVAGFLEAVLTGRRFDLVPTRANGQPAFGTYLHATAGRPATGLVVLAISDDGISAITRFEPAHLPAFGLPAALVDAG